MPIQLRPPTLQANLLKALLHGAFGAHNMYTRMTTTTIDNKKQRSKYWDNLQTNQDDHPHTHTQTVKEINTGNNTHITATTQHTNNWRNNIGTDQQHWQHKWYSMAEHDALTIKYAKTTHAVENTRNKKDEIRIRALMMNKAQRKGYRAKQVQHRDRNRSTCTQHQTKSDNNTTMT